MAAIDRPIATAYISDRTDSVSPTAATAGAPSEATQYTSTTAKTDSMTISSTIGTASSSSAVPMGPSV